MIKFGCLERAMVIKSGSKSWVRFLPRSNIFSLRCAVSHFVTRPNRCPLGNSRVPFSTLTYTAELIFWSIISSISASGTTFIKKIIVIAVVVLVILRMTECSWNYFLYNRDAFRDEILNVLMDSRYAIQEMFKTRAAVFYWDLKPRGAAEWLNYTR